MDKAAGRERVGGSSSTLRLALGRAQDGVEVTRTEGEDAHSALCRCVARQRRGPPVAEFSSEAADGAHPGRRGSLSEGLASAAPCLAKPCSPGLWARADCFSLPTSRKGGKEGGYED